VWTLCLKSDSFCIAVCKPTSWFIIQAATGLQIILLNTINEAYLADSEATMNGQTPWSSHESNFFKNRLLLLSLSLRIAYVVSVRCMLKGMFDLPLSENAPRLKAHTTIHNAPYRQFITSCDDSSTLQQLAFFTYDSVRHF